MKNDGKKKAISPGSRRGQRKDNGKKADVDGLQQHKLTAKDTKYTIIRSKEDIAELEKVKKIFWENGVNSKLKTDSEIYRMLPYEFEKAVKRVIELDHQVEVLTAKLDQLEDLRASFCRCIELSKERKKA